MSDVPVLIVGGGPSGLAAAIELGRGESRCASSSRATLDPLRAGPRPPACGRWSTSAGGGSPIALREAAPLPVAHAQDVVFCTHLLGHEITRFPTRSGSRSSGARSTPSRASRCRSRSSSRYWGCRRRTAHRHCPLGSRVTRVLDGPGEVRADVQHPTGELQEIVADWLLGCDGSGGVARRRLARYEGLSGILPNVSITFRAPELDRQTLCAHGIHYWVIGAERGGLMGRLDLDGIWWAIVRASTPSPRTSMLLRCALGGRCRYRRRGAGDRSLVGAHALVDHYRGQRTFLVGDAAHLNPPWGGHGFNTCVGDAVNIGWKLAAVLQGWAPPSLLDTYEIERRPVAERTIAAAANQEAFLAPSFATADLDADDDAGIQLRAELADASRSSTASSTAWPRARLRLPRLICRRSRRPAAPEPKLDTFVPSAHPGARCRTRGCPTAVRSTTTWTGIHRAAPVSSRDATPLLDAAQRRQCR